MLLYTKYEQRQEKNIMMSKLLKEMAVNMNSGLENKLPGVKTHTWSERSYRVSQNTEGAKNVKYMGNWVIRTCL